MTILSPLVSIKVDHFFVSIEIDQLPDSLVSNMQAIRMGSPWFFIGNVSYKQL